MKLVLAIFLVNILPHNALADFPAEQFKLNQELSHDFDAYYAENAKYKECMHNLNWPPKPLCATCFYSLNLRAAAYAEGILKKCE